ncbi:MAG: PDZ domain-containing protein [Gemmatimonadetes bacterium]|nr:PDZ domain-containing protein [Gemmatimonadota bacterium]
MIVTRTLRLLPAACLFITLGVAPAAAQATGVGPTRPRTAAEDLQLFTQVFNQIRVNHPDSVDSHRILMAAIQAMVQAADPHSYVIPALRLEPGREELLRTGKLYPVPVVFAVSGGAAIVMQVASGTRASQQGILPGDELVSVDGKAFRAESAEELDIELSGPKHSTVSLTFERRRSDGTYGSFLRDVRRERPAEETAVPTALLLDQATGYIRITTFANSRVADDLRKAVEQLEGRGMQRLVLDLRGNGGGSVREAAAVAGEFLPAGSIVYTAEGRRASTADTGRVRRSFFRSERPYPLVVMIDAGTASASELVAGALQDHDRAVVVGQPSFGKSLMMLGMPLSDGSVMQLVVGRIRTPCGRIVQRAYRDVSLRAYYREARTARDTVGRPTCRSAGGRTLYGGGGIFPDVRLTAHDATPAWYIDALDDDLPLKWANQYVSTNADSRTMEAFADSPSLPASAVSGFRALAKEHQVEVPDGEAVDRQLAQHLARQVAYVRWGEAGVYRVAARADPAIGEALRAFSLIPGIK